MLPIPCSSRGAGHILGGERQFVSVLARAAVAVGVAGIFIETHQDPDKAPSDGPNMIPLNELEGLLRRLIELDRVHQTNWSSRSSQELRRELPIPPVLKIVALVVFAQTLFTRAVDPVIPMIAESLAIEVKQRRCSLVRSRSHTHSCSPYSGSSATCSARPA